MTRLLFLLLVLAAAAFFAFREITATPVTLPTATPQRIYAQVEQSGAVVARVEPTPTPEYTVTALALESTAAANAQLFANATKQAIDNAVAEKRATVEFANLQITESVIATAQAAINATHTPTATPTITPTPNATATVYVATSAAQIWQHRVSEAQAHQASAERGAQISTMFAGLIFIVIVTIACGLLFAGWRWLAYTQDDLAEREHRRTLADREHAARLGTAHIERTKDESARAAAEERQASLEHENFIAWRTALRSFLRWWENLPEHARSRPRMEDAQIARRDSWNKCVNVLQKLGAVSVETKGPATVRQLLMTPDQLVHFLTPTNLLAALQAIGEKLEHPPAVAGFNAAHARAIAEQWAATPPPLSDGQAESVTAS